MHNTWQTAKVLLRYKTMNNDISHPEEGINQIDAMAPNVPTERKMGFGWISTNQASLRDAASVIVVPGKSWTDSNKASPRDAASATPVPEGRLVGSIEVKPMLRVPSERQVSMRQVELHQPAGYKKAGKLFVLVFMLAALFMACQQKSKQAPNVQSNAYYTCSMHPRVHDVHPGNCPICGMKLIRVELTGANTGMASDKIVLTASQIQLAGIQLDTVREENTGNGKTLTGIVTTDENKAEELSARIAGRIQQLFVRVTGEKISVGQPVYSIYSEDLLEAEKEYLLAKQQQKMLNNPDVDYQQLANAAANKLQLWGMSQAQIRNLAATGKASATMNILSNVSGTISELAVHEGDYVTEGMLILKTQALGSLWAEAQLYAGEAEAYKENDQVNVSFPDLNGIAIKAKITFINPEFSEGSKVVLLRAGIPNAQGLIKPGMMAYISIDKGNRRALAIPASAILTDGKGSKVWVKNSDGSFSARKINPGVGNSMYISVVSGLSAGEIVVTNGAYLLNSEYIFKNGGDETSMGNMKM